MRSLWQREYSDDRAWLSIRLDLDLSDLFTWNTKQARAFGSFAPLALTLAAAASHPAVIVSFI